MKRGTDPKTFVPLTIIVDEFPTVVDECATDLVLLRKLGQIERELRLQLIALAQTLQIKDLVLKAVERRARTSRSACSHAQPHACQDVCA